MKNILFYYNVVINLLTISCCVDLKDRDLTTPELIEKYGYTPEIHYVTTEDGYILEMHRIVTSPNTSSESFSFNSKGVVFAQHGLTATSADFVLAGPNVALGFYLSDLGYDVWLGNSRGNRYSRNHTTLSPDTSQFWEFSWHEMGVYDLTASIDYILEVTERNTLSYIGHSQGTTMFFVMCTERPIYQYKINLMQALAPVAYLYRTKNLIIRLTAFETNLIEINYLKLPPYEYPPLTHIFHSLSSSLCTNQETKHVCLKMLFHFIGADYKYFNIGLLPVILNHVGTGVSNLNIAHYGQLAIEDRFGQFDYGPELNVEKYGQSTPPDYNISMIIVPVMLIYSPNDILSFPSDIIKLRDTLPNVVDYFEPQIKEYNHWDYIYAKGARKFIYKRMTEILEKYTKDW